MVDYASVGHKSLTLFIIGNLEIYFTKLTLHDIFLQQTLYQLYNLTILRHRCSIFLQSRCSMTNDRKANLIIMLKLRGM